MPLDALRLAFMDITMTEEQRALLHKEADKIEGEQAELVTALRGAMDCASHTMYTKEGVAQQERQRDFAREVLSRFPEVKR